MQCVPLLFLVQEWPASRGCLEAVLGRYSARKKEAVPSPSSEKKVRNIICHREKLSELHIHPAEGFT